MNRELLYIHNPWRTRLFWVCVYLVIATATVLGLYKFGNRLRISTLPEGEINLSIPYSRYLTGEVVTFTITNNFNGSVFIANQCPVEPLLVYKYENSAWNRIHDTATKDCSKEQKMVEIPAKSSVGGNFAPWPNLFKTPGKYRVVAYVEYYNSLPYQDFEIIDPSPIAKPSVTTITQLTSPSKATLKSYQTSSNTSNNTGYTPKTYTITVNSSGNYSTTNITLTAGDAINFVYSPCCGDEVITQFTPIAPTTTSVSSIKLDHDRTSRTVTFTTKGSWRFKAADKSGNTGTITVN